MGRAGLDLLNLKAEEPNECFNKRSLQLFKTLSIGFGAKLWPYCNFFNCRFRLKPLLVERTITLILFNDEDGKLVVCDSCEGVKNCF